MCTLQDMRGSMKICKMYKNVTSRDIARSMEFYKVNDGYMIIFIMHDLLHDLQHFA